MPMGAQMDPCNSSWLGAQVATPISLPNRKRSFSPYRVNSGTLSTNEFWKRGMILCYGVINPSHSGTAAAVTWMSKILDGTARDWAAGIFIGLRVLYLTCTTNPSYGNI
ncbi:hypothetical protein FKM82_024908 [Ascaphus truei]